MLFISATYCDESIIAAMGFSSRFQAKSSFYNRARLLFDADWEKDQLTILQSLFLMSFWRGGPSNIRDVRYWLGVSITLAQTFGLHRSTRFTAGDPNISALRRRIWWSIYVRERQAAASLGLPSRIRDEDCDIEVLTTADLASDVDNNSATNFGAFRPEQVVYITKMVEIARLLGKIIDIHFVPGRIPSPQESVDSLKSALERWRDGLPVDMRNAPEPEQTSVWVHLLHLAYNHLRILVHRGVFLRSHDSSEKQAAISAACRISRIAEDMLAQKTIRFGQMHLITSLFAALCINVIEIRTADDVAKRLAENRAQMCLLGLKEVQKYWSINNIVLDLFFQYLDKSTARRLHGDHTEATRDQTNATISSDGPNFVETASATTTDANLPATSLQTQPEALESDLYLNFFSTSWEGMDNSTLDFGLLFDPVQRPAGTV
ncbi:hypothetical protein BFW01_g2570 [Lasiodiplodia theobromae]|uniref:uncharacterized protein n=1 Tax=Lasiodiplodia theobromae TaxID=45133 RepID=UPI0015C35CA0|nr:uncharacterized protein LTHEOB_5464 [Lasiodiplodia theobromae]KAF4545053.1 hypothetical protein LTHEOB_5464 [Lasiodiplodia theobromae]KAF9631708.1 hypothetical protein BFW01_g2570 [Lasiodiplodia theobromae]